MSRRGLPSVPSPPAPLIACALLLALAFPPLHLVVPSFVGLVPLALWLGRLPAGADGASRALRGGLLTGLMLYALLFLGGTAALLRFTPLGLVAYLAAVLTLSGVLAAVALGVHHAVHRLGLPIWAALPVLWTGGEWLRAHLGPLSFPWLGLGESLTGHPALIGGADLVGGRGIGFWLALCNGLLADVLLRLRPGALERFLPGPAPPAARRGTAKRVLLPALGLAAVLALQLCYSAWRWHDLEPRTAARVAVVQPDVPQALKLAGAPGVDSAVASIRSLVATELRGRSDLDLVVLPETVFPTVVDPVPELGWEGRPELRTFVASTAALAGAPVLYGAVGAEPGSAGNRYRNAVFLRSSEGRRLGRYAKRRLVPLFERAPLAGSPGAADAVAGVLRPRIGGYTPGPEPRLLPAGEARFGVLVCYESIFPELARDYRRRGADFLVNVTNDAWFGGGAPPFRRTAALWQHPAHVVMRAVEHRVGVVRSANTGVSQVVDPRGRVRRAAPLFEPAAFVAPVATTAGPTVFTRRGDLVGAASALASLGVALASIVAARRHR